MSRERRGLAIQLLLTTSLVIAVMAVMSRYFFLYGKSAVWRTDGMAQHYPALYVFNQWLRGIITSLGTEVPLWSWNMGLGADVIGTLVFPVLGDPFALLSLGIPLRFLEYTYAGLLALRVVAAGITSTLYFRKMGAHPVPTAAGVVLYLFVTFLFIQGRHPYFINAMVFLPLLLLGVELALVNERRWPLTMFVFLAGMANFYFFYMLTIITVLYAVARYFEITSREDRWKRLLPVAGKVGGHYLLGMAMAAPLLLPAAAAVLATERASADFVVGLFYPAWVYISQLVAMTTGHFGARSTLLGFGYLAWLMTPVLFIRRKSHTAVKFMIVALSAFIVLPWFGSLLNGLTFPSNRFAFSLGLFLALGTALVLSEDRHFSVPEAAIVVGSFAAYAIPLAVVMRPMPPQISAPMVVGGAVCLAVVLDAVAGRGYRRGVVLWVLLALAVANVVINATYVHDARFGNLLHDFEDAGKVRKRFRENIGSAAAELLPAEGFYRIENAEPVRYNSSMVQGFPGTAFYFSLMDGDITAFRREMDSRPGWSSFAFDGFDERVMINTLLGTQYYLAEPGRRKEARVPYGFEEVSSTEDVRVFSNEHALPLGFLYEQVIDRSVYERLRTVDRQAAMLTGAVVDEGEAPGLPRIEPGPVAVELPYTLAAENGATFHADEGRIDRYIGDASIVLSVPPVEDAELYVEMAQFDNIVGTPRGDGDTFVIEPLESVPGRAPQPDRLATRYTAGLVRKTEEWRTPESAYYWGNRSQLVNLGYQRGEVTTIGIEPELPGTLTFESLKVYALPMRDYPDMVAALQANAMRDIDVSTNRVSGTVVADRDALLFMSIPFSSGWSATLDGEPARLIRANTGFTGVVVPAGEHRVELRYFTPGLREGMAVGIVAALLGLSLWIVPVLRDRRTGPA